ncbi:hypothetical protein [Parafrankia sp. Ea1.12]|uniref:hypothetical protein n=1 Tax=Parafrankia sp. Ea1.12 TaxID=573499 RepID=UPI00135CA400|nr:hypothetical protein [Parafrankia sp. Ea1.12]
MPDRDGAEGDIRGTARYVQVLQTGKGAVLSFRIERYDAMGNRLRPVGAEFTHYQSGQLDDGDEVSGRWSRGTLLAKNTTNLSTGARIHGSAASEKVVTAAGLTFFALFMLFVLAGIFAGAVVG